MAIIKFNATTLKTQLAAVSTAYTTLSEKITEIGDKAATVSTYWSAKEASAFAQDYAKVKSDLSAFITKYEAYVEFINGVISTYETDNQNLISKIKAIGAGNSGQNS